MGPSLLYETDEQGSYLPSALSWSELSRAVATLRPQAARKQGAGAEGVPAERSTGFWSSAKRRNVIVKSFGIEDFGHGARGQVSHGCLQFGLVGKARAGYWGVSERQVCSDPIAHYAKYRVVLLSESVFEGFLEGVAADPKRLAGPIQFIVELLRFWHLPAEKAGLLLGQESSYEVGKLLRGEGELTGRDAKDRIACLFRIRKTLSSLFRDERTENEWLREQHGPLGEQTPLELLLEGSMENILTVKEYVDWTAGR